MAKRGRTKQRKKTAKIDIAVVLWIIVSVVLAVLIYAKPSAFGLALSNFLGGTFGWMKYLIPLATFLVSIYLVSNDKKYFIRKVLQGILFLSCIAIILTIIEFDKVYSIKDGAYWDLATKAYEFGVQNKAAGAYGSLITAPFVKLVGVISTIILSIGIAVMQIVFIIGLKPSEMLANFIEKRKEDLEQNKLIRQEEKKMNLNNKKATKQSIDIPININMDKDRKEQRTKYIYDMDEELIPKKPVNTPKNLNNPTDEELFEEQDEIKEDKSKQVLVLEHALTVEDENYEFPPVTLLQAGKHVDLREKKSRINGTAAQLQKTLYSFGVTAKVENVSVGPAITRYELKPAEGVRVSKIANLADDIALNLAAETIRIEAPIPGKQAVGIEIPNKEKETVNLRDIIDTHKFEDESSKLSFALGKDVAGDEIIADIAKMPHVLVAGSTGSGKSVCINTLIASIIYKAKPSEVKFVMVDPKVVELSVYNGIPHLLIPVVTDPKKAAGALAWAVQEMVNRYSLFASKGVRDIKGYNEALEKEGTEGKLPQIVIIIDELADLMMVAAKDVEDAICRLAQMARAAGMHLVIATQRPSVDVITGIIKANIPSRIAFAVSSQVDSRTILDSVGAEKLLGKGDMLFYPAGASKPTRIQGAFVSDKEVEKIVEFLKSKGAPTYNDDILEKIERSNSTDQELDADSDDDTDPLLTEAIDMVVETGQASTSFIQRRFKVGYARAGRIIDQMEQRGIISGYQGSKPREVLLSKEKLEELKMQKPPEEPIDAQ
ncbi:MAG: DNA translocase FtsK [Lachnospiraceae bacterium]|nr:DNA translocase FtsK [Lachnospiraceae bacterium]